MHLLRIDELYSVNCSNMNAGVKCNAPCSKN